MSIPDAVKAFVISVVRTTLVPLLVGVVAVVAVQAGDVELDPQLAAILTTGFGLAYYVAVRLLERWFPALGIFLVFPRPPAYTRDDFSNFFVSLSRTVVPLVVGLAITTAAKLGLDPSPEGAALITTAVTTAYYALVRLVEGKLPAAGVLLGARGAPSYVPDNGERAGGD